MSFPSSGLFPRAGGLACYLGLGLIALLGSGCVFGQRSVWPQIIGKWALSGFVWNCELTWFLLSRFNA